MRRALETGKLVAPADGPVSWTAHADLAEAAVIALTDEGRLQGITPTSWPLVFRKASQLSSEPMPGHRHALPILEELCNERSQAETRFRHPCVHRSQLSPEGRSPAPDRRAIITDGITSRNHSTTRCIKASASGAPPTKEVQNTRSRIIVASARKDHRRADGVSPRDLRSLPPHELTRKMPVDPFIFFREW